VLGIVPDLLTRDWWRDHGIRIAVVVALAMLLSHLGKAGVRRMRRRQAGHPGQTQELHLQRSATLAAILVSTLRVAVWTMVILVVLGEIGVELAPLIAGAGVAGIAIGFGAQSLVRDLLAGFFILLENQFAVGETVELLVTGGSVKGRVEAMTLRTTSVRAGDGTLSMVPNGNVQLVSNRSRGQGPVFVDVVVEAGADPAEVAGRLDDLLAELRKDAGLTRLLASGPYRMGSEPGPDGQTVLRVSAETRPSRRDQVEGELRTRLRTAFPPTSTGVTVPEPAGSP
jgi:moderate conductance mechanosensitive channel